MININRNKEYSFIEAYKKLIENNNIVITSKNSNYSYAVEKDKIKFFNPIISIWQVCNFFSTEEILDNWYITVVEVERRRAI